MPKTKSFIFEDKDVIAADKKSLVAFWITSISAVASPIVSMLLVVTVFLNNPNAQTIVMFVGASVAISILILGSIVMDSAKDEFARAAELALQRRLLEQTSKLYKPHV